MNESIDLTKILKDCPIGEEFYSPMLGDVVLHHVNPKTKRVYVIPKILDIQMYINADGTLILGGVTSKEIMLFPSEEQRDWSKWECPKTKKERFDPRTLQPFDKVLVRIDGGNACCWFADFVSTPAIEKYDILPCIMSNKDVEMIIPYNDDTKHLVGTTGEAPEYYRYWEE